MSPKCSTWRSPEIPERFQRVTSPPCPKDLSGELEHCVEKSPRRQLNSIGCSGGISTTEARAEEALLIPDSRLVGIREEYCFLQRRKNEGGRSAFTSGPSLSPISPRF